VWCTLDLEHNGAKCALGEHLRIGADRGERLMCVMDGLVEERDTIDLDAGDVSGCNSAANSRHGERRSEIQPCHPSMSDGRAQDGREQHSRALYVGSESGSACHLLQRVHTRNTLAYDMERLVGLPGIRRQRRKLDDLCLLAPFHLDFGGDEPARRRYVAALGYVGSRTVALVTWQPAADLPGLRWFPGTG
jgi:hypothetical protein